MKKVYILHDHAGIFEDIILINAAKARNIAEKSQGRIVAQKAYSIEDALELALFERQLAKNLYNDTSEQIAETYVDFSHQHTVQSESDESLDDMNKLPLAETYEDHNAEILNTVSLDSGESR